MDNNTPNQNDGWKRNARHVIYAMAGFYLLTLAYNMFKAISTTTGTEQILMIIFTILFTIIGLCMIVFGLSAGFKNSKKHRSDDQDQ